MTDMRWQSLLNSLFHKPWIVASGLLPRRAWFIPVLTPLTVFLSRTDEPTHRAHRQKRKMERNTGKRKGKRENI